MPTPPRYDKIEAVLSVDSDNNGAEDNNNGDQDPPKAAEQKDDDNNEQQQKKKKCAPLTSQVRISLLKSKPKNEPAELVAEAEPIAKTKADIENSKTSSSIVSSPKQKAMVTPKAKGRYKMMGSKKDKQSPSSPVNPASSEDSPTASPNSKTYSEKEEDRQLKSGVARHRGQTPRSGAEEEVDVVGGVPGSFSVVTASANTAAAAASRPQINEGSSSSNNSNNNVERHVTMTYSQSQAPSTSNLVQATLVDPVFAVAAKIDEEADIEAQQEVLLTHRKRRFRVILLINLVLGLIGLSVLLYFLLRNNDDNNPTTMVPSVSPAPSLPPSTMAPTTPAPTSHNPYNLPPNTWETILTNVTSPQALAYKWLLEDVEQDTSYFYSISDMNATEWRIHQRFALAVFYYATNSNYNGDGDDDWFFSNNWLVHSENECSWESVPRVYPCQNRGELMNGDATEEGETANTNTNSTRMMIRPEIEPEQYTMLLFRGNGLRGTIPAEVFELLPFLHTVDLSQNVMLTGPIPTEIGLLQPKMGELLEIDLNNTRLSGTLPTELFSLPTLRYLDLSYSRLQGQLPSEIGLLSSSLQEFLLGHNMQLEGSLPTELGLATLLSMMDIQNNQFNGSLPTELGLLTNLDLFHAHENQLSNSIPSEVGAMTALRDLRVYMNLLSGSLPSSIGNLPSIERIIFEENKITGQIPTEWGQLSTLEILNLKDNLLTSTIPTEFGLLSNIRTLTVQRNRLTGTIATELGQPTTLRRLLLHENNMTGPIPPELFGSDLPSLLRLLLYENNLTGKIPSELGRMSLLEDCWIHSNDLTGTLPTEVGLLTTSKLSKLYINDTQVSGAIPDELCGLNAGLVFDCSSSLCGCSCNCTTSFQVAWMDETTSPSQQAFGDQGALMEETTSPTEEGSEE